MQKEIYIDPDVAAVYELHKTTIESKNEIKQVAEWLNLIADNLHAEHAKGNKACIIELGNYHPGLTGKSVNEILNYPLKRDEAELAIALEYGFSSAKSLPSDLTFNVNFERAIDHFINGERDELKEIISAHPGLLTERSPFGHNATLLHYASSNGVEVWRQKVPKNLPDLVSFLIESGADRMATANMYNGEFTTAELAGTSGHPLAAGILTKLIDALVS